MPEDTIEKLVKEKLVALEIEERPGYPEEDLVIRAT